MYLKALIRIESNSLNLKKVYAIDTIYNIHFKLVIQNASRCNKYWLASIIYKFQSCSYPTTNNLSISFKIELTIPDTKKHMIDGLFKMIKIMEKKSSYNYYQIFIYQKSSYNKRRW